MPALHGAKAGPGHGTMPVCRALVVPVGIGVSMLLEYADNSLSITNRVVAGLDELGESAESYLAEQKKKAQNSVGRAIDEVIDHAVASARAVAIRWVQSKIKEYLSPVPGVRQMEDRVKPSLLNRIVTPIIFLLGGFAALIWFIYKIYVLIKGSDDSVVLVDKGSHYMLGVGIGMLDLAFVIIWEQTNCNTVSAEKSRNHTANGNC